MQKERKTISLGKLMLNKGQIDWLPKNPRQWTKDQMALMIKSLDEDPDFMEDRPPLVVPLEGEERERYVVFAGNERTDGEKRRKAVKALDCIVYLPESDEDRTTIVRRAMKDNGHFADWDEDTIANEWDIFLPNFADWGVNLPFLTEEEQKEQGLGEEFSDKIGQVLYEPKETQHKASDLYKDEGAKFSQMIEALQDEDLKKCSGSGRPGSRTLISPRWPIITLTRRPRRSSASSRLWVLCSWTRTRSSRTDLRIS